MIAEAGMSGSDGAGSPELRTRLIDAALVAEILTYGGPEAGLLDLYVIKTRGRLADLQHAVTIGDAADAARIVHSLKGSSATFGASAMAHAAARLSAVSGQELLRLAAASADELRSFFMMTEQAFAAVAAGLGDFPPNGPG